jgi:hypothetical protein
MTIYMVPYYDRLLSQYTEAIYGFRFAPFFPVYDRITPYTDTEIYDRNTGPCNTTKHDRIWRNTDRVRSFTSVYGFHNRRPGIIFFVSHVEKRDCRQMSKLSGKHHLFKCNAEDYF